MSLETRLTALATRVSAECKLLWTTVNGKVAKAGDTMTGTLVVKSWPGSLYGVTIAEDGITARKGYLSSDSTTTREVIIDGTNAMLQVQGTNSVIEFRNASQPPLVGNPSNAAHATHKGYVDTQVATKAPTVHTHVATTDLTATGTKNAGTFLRGDDTWATPPAGGGMTVYKQAAEPVGAAIGAVWVDTDEPTSAPVLVLTQAAYDALGTPDPTTVYVVT